MSRTIGVSTGDASQSEFRRFACELCQHNVTNKLVILRAYVAGTNRYCTRALDASKRAVHKNNIAYHHGPSHTQAYYNQSMVRFMKIHIDIQHSTTTSQDGQAYLGTQTPTSSGLVPVHTLEH